jgi:iron(III) transport system substrate-binding protein
MAVTLVAVATSPSEGSGELASVPKAASALKLVAVSKEAAKGEHPAEIKRLIALANEKGERELSLSWGNSLGGAAGAKMFEALFNRTYGMNIKVNFSPGPSMTDMVGKVTLEVAAGQGPSTDILLGTESHYGPLMNRDVLEGYDYVRLSPRITKDLIAPKDIGLQIGSIASGITYNTNFVAPGDAPKKLEDVLNPKWKGKIASTTNAAIFDRVAMRPEWGAEKMKAFVRRLSEHVSGLIRATESSRIITGEFVMLVMDGGGHEARRQKAKGAPIDVVIPEDASTVGFMYMGVPRTSTRPSLAKLFINLVMSEEGQRIYYQGEFNDHYKLPGSQSAAALRDLTARGIRPLEIDARFVAEHPEMRQLTEELRKLLRK